jgi:hypothetical protein
VARRRYLDDVTRHRIAIDAAVACLAATYGRLVADQRARLATEHLTLTERLDVLARLYAERPLSVGYALHG